MANILSRIRILIGKPTKQDLLNAYYTAKIKKDYCRMRYYFNEIVRFNKVISSDDSKWQSVEVVMGKLNTTQKKELVSRYLPGFILKK